MTTPRNDLSAWQATMCKQFELRARAELGVAEIPGPKANQRIRDYLGSAKLPPDMAGSDETPWCSAFVSWIVGTTGLTATYNAMARSWVNWGAPIRVPIPGAIVVLSRGEPPSGHVGFWVGRDGAEWLILGGNQGDAVSIRKFSASRCLAIRIPTVDLIERTDKKPDR